MRAVSTVVDVAVFMVLVSAGVALLATPVPSQPDVSGDDVAATLSESTATLEFVHGDTSTGPTARRTTSGTHAGLLGRAAVANLSLGDRPLAPDTHDFRRSVGAAVEDALAFNDERTEVVVRWTPYSGAPLAGTVSVGATPPPTVDVSTTKLRVPVPVSSVGEKRTRLDGYDDLGAAAARAVTTRILPETAVESGPVGSPSRAAARQRLAALADALGRSDVARLSEIDREDIERVAGRLRRALAARLAADMRARFDSPAAARDAIDTGHATLVVREWEP